ncbi:MULTISPECIES: hypothetical protein [unclassified Streptomyces]|uniref:hypothetical protein n=1 Tax=unclassified Streptomyces TaxID=2593676 RepID=UPI0037BB142C
MATSRKRFAALAAGAVLAASALVTAPAEAAPAALLQCQGRESTSYDPPLLFQPREVEITIEGRFDSCVDAAGEVTGGAYGEAFTLHAGCNNLLDGFRDRRTFTWSTGESSVADIAGSTTAVAGQVVTTLTGTVVDGRYEGRSLVQVITLPQPDLLLCLTTGLRGATGVTTLTLS